jgi:hypothetical protein
MTLFLGWFNAYVRWKRIHFGARFRLNPDSPHMGTEAVETKDDFSSVTEYELVLATWHEADHRISFFTGMRTAPIHSLSPGF